MERSICHIRILLAFLAMQCVAVVICEGDGASEMKGEGESEKNSSNPFFPSSPAPAAATFVTFLRAIVVGTSGVAFLMAWLQLRGAGDNGGGWSILKSGVKLGSSRGGVCASKPSQSDLEILDEILLATRRDRKTTSSSNQEDEEEFNVVEIGKDPKKTDCSLAPRVSCKPWNDEEALDVCIRGLDIFARRCGEKQRLDKLAAKKKKSQNAKKGHVQEKKRINADEISGREVGSAEDESTIEEKHENGKENEMPLEMISHLAAFATLNRFPNTDRAVSASLALLALIAGNVDVRRRTYESAERYGVQIPIRAMRNALRRAKERDSYDDSNRKTAGNDPSNERLSAELQRKGCLFLGAYVDGDTKASTDVVSKKGLETILDAADWYRHHEGVVTWALWAIFLLCYDHRGNKNQLVLQYNGLQRVCRMMMDIPSSLEIQRHGVAILFDAIREIPSSPEDMAKLRMMALNAGLHDAVRGAMERSQGQQEIVLMGRQMLLATGYTGEIPPFQTSGSKFASAPLPAAK